MNSKRIKTIILRIGFVWLGIVFVFCKGKPESQNDQKSQKVERIQTGLAVDSLMLDINGDGMTDKIKLMTANEKANRILEVKLGQGAEEYKTIAINNEMITCSACGYQGGDPYISLNANEGGFMVNLEHITLYFVYESPDNIYLKKMNILTVKQTPESIQEKHEVYTEKDFGKVEFSKVGSDFRALLN
ncbi:hypothetical protein DN748_00455 [Sinomicrobium soli]|nr:hypothetical protein DN748_00455 [Sinomicrobium sp. N-1-3-6]